MKILYIAQSCSTINGSEDAIGFNIPWESAKINDVYVITRTNQKNNIEEFLSKNKRRNIYFYYVDMPKWSMKIFRASLYSGRLLVWNKKVFPIAEKLCAIENIEIIHQITPIEFRAIGKNGKIINTKFVVGPLGGGEYIPAHLKSYLSIKERIFEFIRKSINTAFVLNFKINKKLDDCNYILFANNETKKVLEKIYNDNKVGIYTEIGVNANEILEKPIQNSNRDKVVFLVCGRLVYRKGHKFLLEVLSRIDLDYECRIVGDGKMMQGLKKICLNTPNLEKKISFIGKKPFTLIKKEYQNADFFIMPSLRETTGSVSLEAMSNGLPLITIDKFGAKIILKDKLSLLYSGDSKEEYIENLKSIIENLIINITDIDVQREDAIKLARINTWEEKVNYYQSIYTKI